MYVHRAQFYAVVVIYYASIFRRRNDLLERLAVHSMPLMIAGDFNIHVDNATDSDASKLSDILTSQSLLQHINTPTHHQGHILGDLFITCDSQVVKILPIEPPLLSDHSFIVADCNCLLSFD